MIRDDATYTFPSLDKLLVPRDSGASHIFPVGEAPSILEQLSMCSAVQPQILSAQHNIREESLRGPSTLLCRVQLLQGVTEGAAKCDPCRVWRTSTHRLWDCKNQR